MAITGAKQWQYVEPNQHSPGQWRTEIALENLTPGELLLPSLALLTAHHYAVRCCLLVGDKTWPLTPVNTDTNATVPQTQALFGAVSVTPANAAVSTHIDLFCVHSALPAARLLVELVSESPPEDYLLVISRRPQQLKLLNSSTPPTAPRPCVAVPSISQMVQPQSQRTRTCSPTSLSMLMSYHGADYQPAFIDQCREPISTQYGVWPLNIMQASRRGFVGAVELIEQWQALAALKAPFIASIRFTPNTLDGAPLPETAGHLVVVRGTNETHVLCNDPAAPDATTVARRYDFAQFSRAWLEFRGAAYIIAPAQVGGS